MKFWMCFDCPGRYGRLDPEGKTGLVRHPQWNEDDPPECTDPAHTPVLMQEAES